MDETLLGKHLLNYAAQLKAGNEAMKAERQERVERRAYYQGWTPERLAAMTEAEFHEYIAKLWSMLIWGNKAYKIGQLIQDNGFGNLKQALSELVWGKAPVSGRWQQFRSRIKGMGPATMSEILGHVHPRECALWNRRAHVGLAYLGVQGLPRYDYQITGERYVWLCSRIGAIARAMQAAGLEDHDLLAADYFIWHELQGEGALSRMHAAPEPPGPAETAKVAGTSDFIHNEIRDKLADIGTWLGFRSAIEVKVADGSKVDTIWESAIGNMGRVIYVFEVQTKGSIDSLMMNLLKALNNPAVQGVVAVSDAPQIEKIRKHAASVSSLAKLKFWDYQDVLETHERLEAVNESINRLSLVPEGF